MAENINQAVGLRLDDADHSRKPGITTYVLNGLTEGFDGNFLAYQSESANEECVNFPDGFKVIGKIAMPELNQSYFWLTNPLTGDGQIGYSTIGKCDYTAIIDDTNQSQKLNFDINRPIQQIVPKATNCSTQFYWADNNGRRYIDLDKLPWQEQYNPNNDFQPIILTGVLDANKLRVQPQYSVPYVEPEVVTTGGNLTMGTYQFAIAYGNSIGDVYTSYYNTSNPLSIWEDKGTGDFNLPTAKSIRVGVKNLDISGLWDYFNIAVVKTVNDISSFELIGTFPVTAKDYSYLYTGTENSTKKLQAADIFEKYQFYDTAEGVFKADDRLGWYGMGQSQKINYQPLWSQVKVGWATTQIPYTKTQGYNNGINTEKYRGYMRDEVVALEGAFVLDTGEITDYFHIPGRAYTAFDIETVYGDDVVNYVDACNPIDGAPRWQVYNTASVTNTYPEYNNDDCYIGPYQYGTTGYYESMELYPNNPTIWQNLAGKPIRHHKLPDCLVSPHHSQGGEFIYPLGLTIDVQSIYDAIAASNLTAEQKARIKGFKIARANRKGQEHVIAKGITFNVGHYHDYEEQQDYLVANWPYNSLEPDPYYSTIKLAPHQGYSEDTKVNYFPERDSHRFAFHSPDTHFGSPTLSNEGEIFKVEQIAYGTSKGHFVKVNKNAEYKFLTRDTLYIGFAAGIASSIGLGLEFGFPQITVSLAVHPENFIPSFTSMLELLEKLTPYTNFGYAHHSTGHYDNYVQVGNSGNKQRRINSNKYIRDGKQSVIDPQITLFNNYHRESLLYVGTDKTLPYPTGYSSQVPSDQSRYNMASLGQHLYSQPAPEQIRERSINAYYGSVKRYMPAQYGRIYSYETIDTGFFHPLYKPDGSQYHSLPIVYGGDTYINRFGLKTKVPLFRDNTVGGTNGQDINYDELGNYGYPMFWLSTKAINPHFSSTTTNILATFQQIIGNPANLLLGGMPTFITAYRLLISVFSDIYGSIATKNTNLDYVQLDKYYELGIMYLFVYGIPYFFVESTVNVDYRQATNETYGDFYPRITEGVPDDWLQEITTPIKYDNSYTYNATFSKQNKEAYFAHLREDWDPTKTCFYDFPNRGIWSDQSSLEEKKNNWLIYKPTNYFDFPKSFGGLVSIDRLADRVTLVRYVNKSQLYNTSTTIDTSIPLKAYLGNAELFKGTPPVDLGGNSSTGYAGSQHKMLIETDFGPVWCDALRGQVIHLQGDKPVDIGDQGWDKWFSRNLPFFISKKFPEIATDNNFKDIGLHGTYDPLFQRILITKLDYLPNDGVQYNGVFYIGTPGTSTYKEVMLGDPEYFCNKSWTISYSFKTQSWISFHSYRPNYYVGHTNYFQSGINSNSSLWNHNTVYDKFHTYYGTVYPYIIEYPFAYKTMDEILQGVRDYCSAYKYTGIDEFYETSDYFNKASAYNRQQHSGTLELIKRSDNDLSQRIGWPKFTTDTKQILYTKSDNFYQWNFITDLVKDTTKPFYTSSCDFALGEKTLDNSALSYVFEPFKRAQIRGKDSKIRLIKDDENTVKLVSRFIITDTQVSIK